MQLTGKAAIRLDGATVRTLDGATLTLGGTNRTAVKGGGRVHGYKEEDMEATLQCKIAHAADVSMKTLNDLTGATVEFETDTGVVIILRQAWTVEPTSLSDGEIDLKMAALESDELTP